MKKLALSTILTVIIQVSVISQGCLPDGIHFKTQEEIDNFSINYPNCTEIEGMVVIDDTIEGNITNLLGLNSLTKTGGNILRISNNSMLTNLIGLENLDSIEFNFEIKNNNSLTSISALENLVSVQNIWIEENPSLINLEGLNQLDTISRISIIENDSLQDLSDLINLKKIRTLLHIENNQSLQNLSGLENLTFVGEDLKIFNNDLLTDLQGLNNLSYLIGFLKVRYNDLLSSLNGLENLDTIVSGLSINDNMILSSMESIMNTHIGYYISIHNNPSLEVCDINSICAFLSTNPDNAEIYNNSAGCNSIEEVEEACDTLRVTNFHEKSRLLLHPNPAKNEVLITGDNNMFINEIIFYNSVGQKVLSVNQFENKIDISELKSGIYFINIVTRQSLISQKLIVK